MRAARALLLLPLLAACQTPEPVAPAPRRVAAAPAPPPAPPVEGQWSFAIAGGRCTARIGHPSASLAIVAGPGRQAVLTLSGPAARLPPGRRTRLEVSAGGPGWNRTTRSTAGAAAVTLPLDAANEARLQDLLGGGTVRATGPGIVLPALKVPDAGASGRDWYGCVDRLGKGEDAPLET